jgi:multicomponent Na+:H+ antiporter subunit G
VAVVITEILMVVGALLMLLAAVGLTRLPDVFTRMQAATKASVLGASCTLLAVAVHFRDLGIATRAGATILFLCLTAPVAAHLIGRAAYSAGVPLWEGTILDELRDRYREEPENEEPEP